APVGLQMPVSGLVYGYYGDFNMRILVIGATGLLGRNLVAAWSPQHAVTGTGSRDCDIRDAAAVRALLQRVQPEVTVLTAAITDVAACERDPALAFALKATGPDNLE